MTVDVSPVVSSEPARLRVLRVASTIDWITATVPSSELTLAHSVYGRHLITSEVERGNPRTQASLHGYVGHTAGRATFAERHDGLYLCARSALAEDAWRGICDLGFRPSRLDLAVTVWFDRECPYLARDAYRAPQGSQGHAGRKVRKMFVCDDLGGSTCYLGVRSSERFGRLYNKHVESKSDKYSFAWRYELELKGEQARLVAEELTHDDRWRDRIACLVGGYFGDRGVSVGWLGDAGEKLPDPVSTLPGDEARLGWLATSVAPAVRELRERVGLRQILEALGLDATAIHDDRELDKPPKRKQLVWRPIRTVEPTETVTPADDAEEGK